MRSARNTWVWLHRWTGLFMALFLVVAGLTGTVLVFAEELDEWLNPELYSVEPRERMLMPDEIVALVEELVPGADANILLDLQRRPEKAAVAFVSARSPLGFDQVFVDQYAGRVLGTRLRSENILDRAHVVPILLRVHNAILLPEPWGRWLMGGVALLWTANCFVGFYLTLPTRARRFFATWKMAWRIRRTWSIRPLSYDLHRAASLWLWAVLLILALSSVQFNLGSEVFEPALTAVLPYHDPWQSVPEPDASQSNLGWNQALAQGRKLMMEHAQREGFEIEGESTLAFNRGAGVFVYTVRSTLDIRDRFGDTRVLFSATEGRELGYTHPRIASGNAFSSWLSALHTGRVWGWPFRLFIGLMGLATVAVSISGFLIWYFKRGASRSVRSQPVAVRS
jgi:uncharacterized iron-regulated membrane protein